MNNIAKDYKKRIASRYLPISNEDIKSKIIEVDEYALSVKLDGHFYILHFNGKKATLYNHGQKCIEKGPIIEEAEKLFKGVKEITLAGELYCIKPGKRTYSFDLSSELTGDLQNVSFAAFDIISMDNEEFLFGIKAIDQKLTNLLKGGKSLHAVENKFVSSRTDIDDYFNKVVITDGNEGIVVKCDNGPTYKVKQLFTLDAVVLGFAEGEGKQEGMMRELLVGLKKDGNNYLNIARISNGFSEKERKDLLKKYEKQKVGSDYLEVAGTNVAFTMVQPKDVIEFSCLDILTESSKGQIRKVALEYKGKEYHSQGHEASVSIIAGVFLRFRSDKNVDETDVGLNQITKHVELLKSKSNNQTYPKSKLLKREVYVKESKGKKMVRKFVMWKTNKEQTGDYPAYVFHYTDFSPNRAEMLKKDIRISATAKGIENAYNEEIAENVKSGWKKA